MEFTFLSAAGVTLFTRSDAETAHWVQEEMAVTATFPYMAEKVIERGQRVAFRDPATDTIEVFEVRSVSTMEPDHYQQISAEAICISELQDEHINSTEITDKTAAQALTTALTGTLWSVGTVTASGTQSADISRGSVWQAVSTIKQNWNVYIEPRVVITNGAITGRFLDISPAQGTWRGVRLSVRKNMLDATVTYNDEDVLTALYGYGGAVKKRHSGSDDTNDELTFADVAWTATGGHPAKPAGQTYLEDPTKTAIYGRNGRPRFGYYQNSSITDANVLLQKTWEALQRTYEPRISITGTVADLYRLGYKDEPLRLHDIAIVEIEETGESFQKEIIRLDVDLIDPTGNRPDIGDYIPNIIYIDRTTSSHASGGGGGGGTGETNQEYSETYAQFYVTQLQDQVGLVVGTRNGGYYVKAGEIALSINKSGETGQYESTALINADHVNISATSTAYTLAGSLERTADGKLLIKDAGGLYVQRTEAGVTSQFGVWDNGNLTGGVIVDKVNGSTNTYITGDHVNISATSTVHTLAGAMHVDNSGKLIIDSAGGMYVERTESGTTAQFGVWDRGNMTGLTIAQLVNGETNATLNADHVNISGTSTVHTLAGAMHVDNSGKLIIDSAGGMYVERTESGTTAQFGVWDRGNMTGLTIAQLVNGETNALLNADHVNISATSTAYTLAGALEHDANGRLVIKDAGGLYVRRTESGVTSTFGVFDNGNLTGGVIVNKVNGSTSTYITGDHVNISATSTVQTLAGAMHKDASGNLVLDTAAGMYVNRASGSSTATFGVWDRGNLTGGVMVQQINGQTTTKLSGDVIDISSLALSINASTITIDADRIDINGIVSDLRALDLSVQMLTCEGLTAGDDIEAKADIYVDGTIYAPSIDGCSITNGESIDCTSVTASGTVRAGTLRCNGRTYTSTLTVNGTAVIWRSKTVVDSFTKATIGLTPAYTVTDTSGVNRTFQGVSSFNGGSVTTTTIHYLGD